jgi:hypothetical protein
MAPRDTRGDSPPPGPARQCPDGRRAAPFAPHGAHRGSFGPVPSRRDGGLSPVTARRGRSGSVRSRGPRGHGADRRRSGDPGDLFGRLARQGAADFDVVLERAVLPHAVDESLAQPQLALARRTLRVDPDPVADAHELLHVWIDRGLPPIQHSLGLPPVLLLFDPPPKLGCSCCVHETSPSSRSCFRTIGLDADGLEHTMHSIEGEWGPKGVGPDRRWGVNYPFGSGCSGRPGLYLRRAHAWARTGGLGERMQRRAQAGHWQVWRRCRSTASAGRTTGPACLRMHRSPAAPPALSIRPPLPSRPFCGSSLPVARGNWNCLGGRRRSG